MLNGRQIRTPLLLMRIVAHRQSSSSKSVTFGGTYGALATTSRTGYTFNGWFTATSGGTEIESSDTVSTASNQTLYAQWTENTLAISPSSTNVTVPEGNTATFTVVLSAQPASNVTVNVARNSGDGDVSVSGGSSLVSPQATGMMRKRLPWQLLKITTPAMALPPFV